MSVNGVNGRPKLADLQRLLKSFGNKGQAQRANQDKRLTKEGSIFDKAAKGVEGTQQTNGVQRNNMSFGAKFGANAANPVMGGHANHASSVDPNMVIANLKGTDTAVLLSVAQGLEQDLQADIPASMQHRIKGQIGRAHV